MNGQTIKEIDRKYCDNNQNLSQICIGYPSTHWGQNIVYLSLDSTIKSLFEYAFRLSRLPLIGLILIRIEHRCNNSVIYSIENQLS